MTRRGFTLLALCLLSFACGAACTYKEYFPYSLIDEASAAIGALQEQRKIVSEQDGRTIRHVAEEPVVVSLPGAYQGYTVYSMYDSSRAQMVDMQGRVVHSWRLRNPGGGVPASRINWFDLHAFPNGDLLVVEEQEGAFPYGFGVRKLDKDSKTLWRSSVKAHHAANIADDGRIAILWHRGANGRALLGDAFKGKKVLEEMLGVLSPEGELLQQVSLTKILVDNGFGDWLRDVPKADEWDVVHSNSAMLLDATLAPHFPMYALGSMLVSMRNGSVIAVVDMEKLTVPLFKTSLWRGQHDAQFTEDGTLLLFDNRGMLKEGGKNRLKPGAPGSRIVSYDPAKDESRVLYGSKPGQEFFTSQRGRVKKLPNGDLLITVSDNGRIIEINDRQETVWEFFNPYMDNHDTRVRIQTAKRYPAGYFDFLEAKMPE